MRRARWLAPWKDSGEKPVIYHCITRVVERRLAFEAEEKEQFRCYMRMYENFSGCRVLAYCLMGNHVHILLEVPPMRVGGLADEDLLKRLRAIYPESVVKPVAKELDEAREAIRAGRAVDKCATAIHERYTYRMHNLGEFMKTLLGRFTRWFNRRHTRTGTLWESRFKSVLVEDGMAARTMAAYIDLNPVRAGIVSDPAAYRWSSYGEAVGGGARGNGKKARAGLVRALMAHQEYEADARHWVGKVSKRYRIILLVEGGEQLQEVVGEDGTRDVKVVRKGMRQEVVDEELGRLQRSRDVAIGRMLRCRVRYFTDGAVIGSRAFVDGVFTECRERFGQRRKTGARKMRGSAAAAAGALWSIRDLKIEIG
ncbi:MAG: chemotaxis protein CheW [Verrucomicrobia bacterium]|nr:MAG: chemotaxis protein CheW [Verrucomicrobiota bacterium]